MKSDWVARISDRVEQHVRQVKGEHATIICASGLSPSGTVHLGNLREIMTVHIVAEELRARGWQVEHIQFWDDYDRLRKIPAGIQTSFEQYIGQPLCDVPDPFGEYASYAERYITEFSEGLAHLGVPMTHVRQSLAYREGRYTEKVKFAMAHRGELFDILSEYQTHQGQQESINERRAAYYPYRVYCESCGKDTTQVQHYDEATARIEYTCQNCQHHGSFSLDEKISGKLVWKVDWPMRWSFAEVDFEPAGADHSTPGSSFTVGQRIVQEIFHSPTPQYASYAFVGMEGRVKISSSAGTNASLASALAILEPAILRWLYIRRANNQPFMIDYGQGLLRLYDEWDSLSRQIASGKANEANQLAYKRATQGSAGSIKRAERNVPFSLLTSTMDVTQGNVEQVLRIATQTLKEERQIEPTQLEPRLTCALNWVNNYLPEDERTTIRTSFDAEAYTQLPESEQAALHLLVEEFENAWSLDALTDLMYRIPKQVRGLPADAPATPELKQAQRAFFVAIYTLICASDTGPRIPTLMLSLGKEKVKSLLTPDGVSAQAEQPA
ncbi:lysine--tRNA ligase [Ktedonospora formicarum]|uniref:Lysine--tRNA ligase n=1 Tax=Ktedonospora formicarum TaxID=2778364 RepID=A0A8J3HZ51_9CHLR|nr:lysine--tRNA ligase [Ktedonospora formicarum]GHO44656.1 lysine--tRNA ligase [Ktedonospora formicarum]